MDKVGGRDRRGHPGCGATIPRLLAVRRAAAGHPGRLPRLLPLPVRAGQRGDGAVRAVRRGRARHRSRRSRAARGNGPGRCSPCCRSAGCWSPSARCCRSNNWAAAAGMFVLGFAVSFVGVGGPRLVGLAAGMQLLYILPCFPPYDPGSLGDRLAGADPGRLAARRAPNCCSGRIRRRFRTAGSWPTRSTAWPDASARWPTPGPATRAAGTGWPRCCRRPPRRRRRCGRRGCHPPNGPRRPGAATGRWSRPRAPRG